MSLQMLPEELLVIIIRQLDLLSVKNLYKAGNAHINNVIGSQGVIKKCHFTQNSMATVHSLKARFFRSISTYLQELSLSGVHDLSKTLLLPAVNRLKNLLTLDVSYTCISIFDLLDIYEKCPTIKNVALDYQFGKPNAEKPFTEKMMMKCQDVFANFTNVTFVGSLDNLLYSKLPHKILEKATLDTLIYTITKVDKMFTYYKYVECKTPSCNKFFVNILNWKSHFLFPQSCPTAEVFEQVDFEYEYLLITWQVYCSEVFTKFLDEKFKIKGVLTLSSGCLMSNSTFLIWRKDTTTFDDSFFSDLYLRLKDHFPHMKSYSQDLLPETFSSNWVCVTHPPIDCCRNLDNEPAFKKRRVATTNIKLNYDSYLENLNRAKLSIKFCDHVRCPVTISPKCNFLKKLTFLSLTGSVRYSAEFFNVLFRQCDKLITLNVEAPSVSACILPISRNIPLSQSLKNLRIVDKNIDCDLLFSSLAQCRTLENIQILDQSLLPNHLFKPDMLFQQCKKLYYFSILAHISGMAKKNNLQMLNKSKKKYGRNNLFIELLGDSDIPSYTYDPYIEVFQLYPIKAVQ